ncbi:ATPase [Sphingomonas paeninsulae]|uniref:histidine kinase n=1 Tax=Sphingomonas paeninsulae TaxID=2319844 RepID=A0A494TDQ1_SPHPE|nr:ATP-binding protein [Sphingomonas paeninsulae]AYJ87360.1 ATPase [Sphingomonas paeninsulae]
MNSVSTTRIVIALIVTAAIALGVQLAGPNLSAFVTAVLAGVGTLLILTIGRAEIAPMNISRLEPETIHDAEARLVEAIGEPVLVATDGRVRIANAAARTLLGAHIVDEDLRVAIRHPAAAERLAPDAPDGSVELVGLGGRDQRVQMRVATAGLGAGSVERVIHLIDRTTSHAAERARVDFVANASHELRTPLAAILGFIETLDDEKAGSDAEVRGRFLGVMFKEARRMQRLIDDLISLSRIEAEKYQLPETAVELPTLIEEVAGELRDEAGARRADLILKLDDDIPDISADRAQISQVLHNLIGNAYKYGRAPVTLSLTHEGPLIRLSVTDQGEGILPEHLPRLTERFYRVDSGRSRSLGGTGLGLAIVKHIVERHRGRLEIVSKMGVGTTVSILLPPAPSSTVTKPSQN